MKKNSVFIAIFSITLPLMSVVAQTELAINEKTATDTSNHVIAESTVASESTIVPQAVSNMVQLTQNWKTFSGSFKQSAYSETGELMEKSEGEVTMSLPDLIRWHVKTPYEQIIIANQTILYSYDVDLEQINLQPIDEFVVNTPAKLLTLKPIQVNQQFIVNQLVDGDTQSFTLKPRAAESMYDVIQLTFTAGVLNHISLLDSLGQKSEVNFIKTAVNPMIDDKVFEMIRPEGVDVIDSSKG
jgi:outer membrane lipoprotein carrier protein